MMKNCKNVTINNYYIHAKNIYVNDGIYVSAIHDQAYAPSMLPPSHHDYYYTNDDLSDGMPQQPYLVSNGYSPQPYPVANGYSPQPYPVANGFSHQPYPVANGFSQQPYLVSNGFPQPPYPVANGFSQPPYPVANGFPQPQTRGKHHCSNCGKVGHNIRTCKKC